MDMDGVIGQVRDGLEREFGNLTTWELSEGIINVYSKPVPADGPEPVADSYLCTVTVTRTP